MEGSNKQFEMDDREIDLKQDVVEQNLRKWVQNPYKISQKRDQIVKNAPLERFWRQIACGSAQDADITSVLSPSGCFLAENVAPRLDFGTPEKSQICPKPHFWA